ncbi:PREDICTED: uncharacterized protein LOC101633225 [Condylura cristata]|uniref:uncharacterized protein LOC101633225 n=1 Tax=Condylura cristata TaxID=143302 RepID=UPI0006430D58|nr:PREDICTED: uncharacterized protein LOC101633225 [Condylura cristata]
MGVSPAFLQTQCDGPLGLYVSVFLFVLKGAQVEQSPPSLSLQEGKNFTLKCNTSMSVQGVQWFQQKPGGSLVTLFYTASETPKHKGRRSTILHFNDKNSSLLIVDSQLEDSGTYFCAMQAQCSRFMEESKIKRMGVGWCGSANPKRPVGPASCYLQFCIPVQELPQDLSETLCPESRIVGGQNRQGFKVETVSASGDSYERGTGKKREWLRVCIGDDPLGSECLSSFHPGVRGLQVEQSPTFLSLQEGKNATLICNFSTTVTQVQWFRQKPGGSLVTLFYITSETPKQEGRLITTLKFKDTDTDKDKYSTLNITGSQLEDSATYLCAGRHSAVLRGVRGLQVEQNPSVLNLQEGENTTLSCKFPNTVSYVQWFRQKPRGSPVTLFYITSVTPKQEGRLSAALHTEDKDKYSTLYIAGSQLEDSATYLCAGRHSAQG